MGAFLSVRIKCSSQLSEPKAFTPAIKSLKGTEQRNRICLTSSEVEKDPSSLSRNNVVGILVQQLLQYLHRASIAAARKADCCFVTHFIIGVGQSRSEG